MSPIPLSPIHPLLFFLLSQASLLTALPALPDPASLQPSLLFLASSTPAAPGIHAATIPAFPEQSDIAGACRLDPADALLPAVSSACSAGTGGGLPSRSRCCPALGAWLYAAYGATALAARALLVPPAAAALDLPVVPEDAEACAGAVDRALRTRGLALPRPNGTCDAAFCYCGIRLRRLTCVAASSSATSDGRWAPMPDAARRLERDCIRPGVAGCSRCLRALNQLKGTGNLTAAEQRESGSRGRDCQLMGLTWLLKKNGSLYLPAATAALRALMAADDASAVADPNSCSVPSEDLPLAVDSAQIDGDDGSSAVRPSASVAAGHLLLLTLFIFHLVF